MNNLKKTISFILALLLIVFLGACNSKIYTIEEVYNGTSDTYTINAKCEYVSNSYIIFRDDTGILVYKTSNENVDVNTSKCYKIKIKVNEINNIKQITKITQIDLIDTFAVKDEQIEKVDKNFSVDVNRTSKIEISGYVEYNDIFYVNNKYLDIKAYTENAFDSTKLEVMYDRYVKVKGYVVGIKDNSMLDLAITSVEESFDMGEDTSMLDLHILEMNDTHGYCMQDENDKNGLSNMAYIINQIREESNENTVLIANGDMFQGTALSNITYGKAMVEIMNAMKVDCMTLGNHEFDWGIEKVLQYFDKDSSNGEANFPLLNANVYKNGGTLLTVENGNVFESTIINRSGINIGVIGCIGDVYTSINYLRVKDYYFENNIENTVSKIGTKLKDEGCDIIVVAVHGGNSSGVENYVVNNKLASLKYKEGYLVDAVINGHTHTKQNGYIERTSGLKLPVVQAGCNGKALGDIVLKVDEKSKKVIASVIKSHNVYEADTNYDDKVEEVVRKQRKENESKLSEVYSVAGETIETQYDLIPWVGNVLVSGTGADVAVCNTGGLRSNGNIKKGSNITIENMYMINPFDNEIILVKVKGNLLAQFMQNGKMFFGKKENLGELEMNTEYLVAVVDYVYYGGDFPQNETAYSTGIIMRDLLIEDIKLHSVFSPIRDPKAKITFKENKIQTNIYYKKEDLYENYCY